MIIVGAVHVQRAGGRGDHIQQFRRHAQHAHSGLTSLPLDGMTSPDWSELSQVVIAGQRLTDCERRYERDWNIVLLRAVCADADTISLTSMYSVSQKKSPP